MVLQGSGPGKASRGDRGWLRAAALFLLALGFSVAQPSILVAVGFLLLLMALPVPRSGAYALGALAALFVLGGERTGLWWTERGWALLVAGWFVALTLRWPSARFLARALGAVAGALAVVFAIMGGRPEVWGVLDWQVAERMRAGLGVALEAMRLLQEGQTLSPALVSAVYRTAEVQSEVFPALVALASLASLGVAWWLYQRSAYGSDRGLAPLKEFRFNDQLVWLFISGVVFLLLGGEAWRRAGANAVLFMGALYALRGAAVVSFFGGGQSLVGVLLLVLGLLFVAPVILVGAVVIGLGDTWLDLRSRAREMTA